MNDKHEPRHHHHHHRHHVGRHGGHHVGGHGLHHGHHQGHRGGQDDFRLEGAGGGENDAQDGAAGESDQHGHHHHDEHGHHHRHENGHRHAGLGNHGRHAHGEQKHPKKDRRFWRRKHGAAEQPDLPRPPLPLIPLLGVAALCLVYVVHASTVTWVLVAVGGVALSFRYPETAVGFLAFGWVAERQVMTYSSGLPFLIAGLVGPALRLVKGIRPLLKDNAFLAFVGVTTAYCLFTIAARPEWQAYGWNRLLYVAIAVGVYCLCTSRRARTVFEDASIAAGVVVSTNAIIAAGMYGEGILHTGGDIELRLVDSNYGSIAIVFALALALERLPGKRLWSLESGLHAGAVLINLWGLLVLASRGAQVATGAVLLAWLASALFGKRMRAGLGTAAAAVVLVGLTAYLALTTAGIDVLRQNEERWQDVSVQGASGRVDLAKDSWAVISRHPFTVAKGGGIGYNLDVLGGQSVHNQLLDTLFDYGLPGLLVLMWMWWRLLTAGVRRRKGGRPAVRAPVLPALGVGVCGLALAPIWFGFFWVELAYMAARVGPAGVGRRTGHRRHRKHLHRRRRSEGQSEIAAEVAEIKPGLISASSDAGNQTGSDFRVAGTGESLTAPDSQAAREVQPSAGAAEKSNPV